MGYSISLAISVNKLTTDSSQIVFVIYFTLFNFLQIAVKYYDKIDMFLFQVRLYLL